jgi:hypothetical protein
LDDIDEDDSYDNNGDNEEEVGNWWNGQEWNQHDS